MSLTIMDALEDLLGDNVKVDVVHVQRVVAQGLQSLLDADLLDLGLGAISLDDKLLFRFGSGLH